MVNSPERSSGSVNGDRFPATSSPMVASGAASRVIDSTILNQAILQQIPGLQLQPSFSAANDSAANEVVTAMQQLLEAVDQSAPEPDFLMAEVHQKAQQVIQVLQAHPLEGSATNLERSAPYSAQLPIQHPAQHSIQNYVCLKDLTPWLLWGIARSAYGTMGLLEGVPATVLQPDQHWRNGILRLVALLEVRTPNFFYRFDLATQQVPEVLESDDLIQLGDSTFYPQPTTIAAATHRLVAQIQNHYTYATTLLPGHSYRSLASSSILATCYLSTSVRF
ncbi:MAG: hypothetical protein HC772_17230 [Leptolyngbyaceae cyanobacterium CRU_2_3]|nr:hypothetical protein [Leptolyngbyaceae cyanobacterium CRU_2_3]